MVLAQLLAESFDVEIIGPVFGRHIWQPFPGDSLNLKSVTGRYHPFYIKTKQDIFRAVTGDLIYAVKPRPSSLEIGLHIAAKKQLPLILDIDDDELALFHPLYRFAGGIHTLLSPNGYFHTRRTARKIKYADGITTASAYFRKKYGGVVIPHARDHELFNPARHAGWKIKEQLGWTEYTLVMFLGTPRPHKGLETILEAFRIRNDDALRLALIGAEPDKRYVKKLFRMGGNRILLHPPIPFHAAPEFLAAADMVVLPQRASRRSTGQIPAKLIDAMMMARPIIASNASRDVQEILDQCGIVVSAEDASGLAKAIQRFQTDRNFAEQMGANARKQAVERFSLQRVSPLLSSFVRRILDNS